MYVGMEGGKECKLGSGFYRIAEVGEYGWVKD